MSDLTFEQLFADLVEAEKTTLPERYFTVQEYVEETGLSYSTARRRLRQQCEDGALEGKKAIIDGYETWAYWFPETDSKTEDGDE